MSDYRVRVTVFQPGIIVRFKEIVYLLTKPKMSIQCPKINQKNYGEQAREYCQLPPICWKYPQCSKAEWRVTGQTTTSPQQKEKAYLDLPIDHLD